MAKGSGGVVGLVPEEKLITHGEQREEQELEMRGPGGEAVVEVVIELLEDEELGPEVAVSELLQDGVVPVPGDEGHIREGDEAPGVELDEGGVERGQPEVVGLEYLRPDLGDLDEIPELLLVFLSHVGILNAGLVMLSSEPDPLEDDWKLTGEHSRTRSGKEAMD